MRRASVLLLAAVVLLGTVLVGEAALVAAQDSTPPAGQVEVGEGVAVEFLGLGETETLPPSPAYIQLFRIIIKPGGSFAIPEYPSTALASVESGTVTLSVDASITVLHVPEDGQLDPDDQKVFPANEAFTLEEGDSALFPPNVEGEARNDGEEDTSILVANIFAIDRSDESDRPAPIEASIPVT